MKILGLKRHGAHNMIKIVHNILVGEENEYT
jgi:hypothetical protein